MHGSVHRIKKVSTPPQRPRHDGGPYDFYTLAAQPERQPSPCSCVDLARRPHYWQASRHEPFFRLPRKPCGLWLRPCCALNLDRTKLACSAIRNARPRFTGRPGLWLRLTRSGDAIDSVAPNRITLRRNHESSLAIIGKPRIRGCQSSRTWLPRLSLLRRPSRRRRHPSARR